MLRLGSCCADGPPGRLVAEMLLVAPAALAGCCGENTSIATPPSTAMPAPGGVGLGLRSSLTLKRPTLYVRLMVGDIVSIIALLR